MGDLVSALVERPVAEALTAAGECDGLGGTVYLRLDQSFHPRGPGPLDRRVGPPGDEPSALRVAEERRLRDPPRRIGAEGAEQPEVVPAHPSDRLGLEEARSFSTLIQQSAELGSSITDALRVYSDDMRHKRLSLAEEKAYSLPAKLAIPMMICIFPVLFVVILLPVVVRLYTGHY